MTRSARGFTLVEMLVTLVIVGLVSTLLWQALAQVAQIETRLADGRALADNDRLRRAWVQQALAGIATGPQGTPEAVRGSPHRLSSHTTMPPWPSAGGLERMTLTLSSERRGAETGMVLRAQPAGGEDTSDARDDALVLWRWPGEGRFEYLAADGRWLPSWPPDSTTQASDAVALRLPLAVRLLGPPTGAVWVPLLVEPSPLISRRAVWQDDDARQ